MNVSFVTPSVSRALGGIYEIERCLAQALQAHTPAQVDVFGLHDAHTDEDLPEWEPLRPHVYTPTGPAAFGYAPEMLADLLEHAADVAHLHALWMFTSIATRSWSRSTGQPHVITINGMLDDWALENSAMKKKVAGWLYENDNLREAACLHVNTEEELRAVRRYGLENPVCIIPNGVTLPDPEPDPPAPWGARIPDSANVLLFLGRIHPKKGIDRLIRAWANASADVRDGWHIAIVGWDDGGHRAKLESMLQQHGVASSIHFLGSMFGDEKDAAYHHADAFVLPTHSEGLPMAVLEAWSHGLPTLITDACNFPEAINDGAAIRIENDVPTLTQDLERALSMPAAERAAVGERARMLVQETYTWKRVAQQLYDVYAWTLGRAPKPDTVRS